MLISSGLKDLTAHAIAAWFVRLVLRFRRKNGLLCRNCGLPVPVEDVPRFVSEGCLSCGERKLNLC